MARRHDWSPDFAPHVRGWYEERELDEDGLPMEAPVEATCEKCGETFRRKCASGMMRQWIARFASVHLHRDPLDPLPKKEGA